MNLDSGSPVTASTDSGESNGPNSLQYFVFGLFFVFGGITSLNDVLIPKLKDLFTLSYGEVMLVQFAFFGAYLTVSMPAATLVKRLGYMRTAVVGLLVMMAGCLLFIPASRYALFNVFLLALFVLATGVTIVQVVANPLISMLGRPASAGSRLTFAQGFNSLGTTLFPYFGSLLILGSLSGLRASALTGEALNRYRGAESQVIVNTYLGLAVALALVATAVWSMRQQLKEATVQESGFLQAFELLRRSRFAFGCLCIFLYVGAEVTIGSLIVSYLMQPSVLGLADQDAGKHIPFYWGGAMIGRFVGAWLLRRFFPGKVLAVAATAAVLLLATSATTAGLVSGWSLIAIGLFNSVMFPTIFTLASEGLGSRTAEGSGVLCMAIVGGAVIPLLSGVVADHTTLRVALAIPAVCYGLILAFGCYAQLRPVKA